MVGSDGGMLMFPQFTDRSSSAGAGGGKRPAGGAALDPASSQSTSSPVKFLERLSSAPDFSGLFLTWQNSTES